ncbi:MAG: aminotransferase class I/II-fold pyridoxal phosphate-dependent enzyme [candidate division WOR-3 bacterium]|nr:aminotransferase class I/II-fold pyridoxal phosphate-dependent enzyme [candidate division WOR-3 bacterium]
MKPYQVNLFTEQEKVVMFLPSEPVFVHNNKRYLNFTLNDCFNRRNNEYLIENAKLNIDNRSITDIQNPDGFLEGLKKSMCEFKKIESLIVFSDEISAIYSISSIFGLKTTFFIDYETNPAICAVLQYRNVEFYNHKDLDHFSKLLASHTEKVVIIDGLYEWLGYSGPINDLLKIAKENQAIIIANEINSFGLLGRDGRGIMDLYNLYDDVNIEIGSFSRYIGGYGAYIGAKKYLINKILDNNNGIVTPVPKFMLAVNLASLEILKNESRNNQNFSKLWTNSRFFINRLKQIGLKTLSETPVVVIILNNNQEAEVLKRRLFEDGIITSANKERLRFILSIEHSRADIEYTLDRIESHFKSMGIVYPSLA